MSIDLAAVGCHDFDFGVDLLKQRMGESGFPWISSNIFSNPGDCIKNETKIFEIDGIKIGIFALTTPMAEVLSEMDGSLYFASTLHMAKQKCAELKKADVDVIIAMTHQPIEEDRKLLRESLGIDLLLGSFDRESITWFENKTLIHERGSKDSHLTRIDLVIEKKMNQFHQKQVRIYPSFRYLEHKNKTRNAHILKKMENYYAKCKENFDEPIGILEKAMDSRFERMRSRESTVGNLIADAAFSCFSADGAILPARLIQGDRYYPPGMVLTKQHIYKELPFGGRLVLVELSGKELIESLEAALYFVEKKGEAFPQVAGLSFTFDAQRPPGSRLGEVKIGQESLRADKIYKIVTEKGLSEGRKGLSIVKKTKILPGSELNTSLPEAVIRYIQKKKKIEPAFQARIIAIDP